ncbi:MAG: hypothetical protein P8129_02050 [Anaerolineae bacterium]|jgi:hypothetical protein
MRKALYIIVLLAMLAIPFTSAFADEPQTVEQIPDGWWLLGELWTTPAGLAATPLWSPFEPVDAYMYRPSTLGPDPNVYDAVWPLTQAPILGTWWMEMGASEQRRMSYAEDYFFANAFGGYYAEFMLPRDEVWFPCSFPLKWKCNYVIDPFTIEYHSPAAMAYECQNLDPFTTVCLDWPWAVAPYDTISPVTIDVFNTNAPFPWGVQYELEIAGMFWKFSDIP